MDRRAIRLQLKKTLAAARRATLGRRPTDAAGAYRPTSPPPRWSRVVFLRVLGAKERGVVPAGWA
jgi:hypothetical protein